VHDNIAKQPRMNTNLANCGPGISEIRVHSWLLFSKQTLARREAPARRHHERLSQARLGNFSNAQNQEGRPSEHWPCDVKKCTSMRVGNQRGASCGTCIIVCPWNKPYTPLHRAVGSLMRHSSLARNLAVWADDLMGYGKPDYTRNWRHYGYHKKRFGYFERFQI
jgi:ferredoxin